MLLAALGPFSLVGIYRAWMLVRYAQVRRSDRATEADPRADAEHAASTPVPADLPRVTVQLPLYDEPQVAARVVRAALNLDYPLDRLEVQVLDDSDDATPGEVRRALRHAPPGLAVFHLRRSHRRGYKAGALDWGLRQSRGELVAIFDADFVPAPDFLLRMVPHFADPRVGMAQARWSFLDEARSPLTEAQSVLLDTHFGVEHRVHHRTGSMWNFNGTAGVWRRQTIESAGGWRADTLTEDLDLSYRAQLRGWRFVYDDGVRVPSEIPARVGALRTQQYRWSKGMSQVARRILPRLLQAPLPLRVKVDAVFHLLANTGYLAVAFTSLILPPLLVAEADSLRVTPWWPAASVFVLLTNSVAVALFLGTGTWSNHGRLGTTLRRLALVVPIGVALSVTGAVGTVVGWWQSGGTFERTPKEGTAVGSRPSPRMGTPRPLLVVLEVAMALYHLGWAWEIVRWGRLDLLPLVLVFAPGYLYLSVLELCGRKRRFLTETKRSRDLIFD